MARVLVTGANGFIGRATIRRLDTGHLVRPLVRSAASAEGLQPAAEAIDYGDADALARRADGADVVIHLADDPARDGSDATPSPATRAVAEAVAGTADTRLIYASSVYAGRDDSAYARRKLAVERLFQDRLGTRAVGVRLTPVYDDTGRGSLGRLRRLAGTGLPLPFRRANAEREYLAVENAADLFHHLVELDPAGWRRVAGRVWAASDGERLTTRALVERLGRLDGKTVRLLPLPGALVSRLAGLAGQKAVAEAAFGELTIASDEDIRSATDWTPPLTMVDQLRAPT